MNIKINKKYYWVAGVISLLFSHCSSAYETVVPRYALVIGNANYQFSPLKNPENDARDMASILRTLRYDVTVGINQNPSQLRKLVKDFYAQIKDSDAVSLFYYAGHAIQANNVNYLIPVKGNIRSYESLKTQALSSDDLLRSLRLSSSKQNIIIMDACRNNPFKLSNRKNQSRGLKVEDKVLLTLLQGLAPIEAPRGTLIAYSTEPGNTAADGQGRNGTYTSALLRHISKSETAEALFKKVRRDVLSTTQNKQTPWEHSSLIETFYFIPPSNEEMPDIISF